MVGLLCLAASMVDGAEAPLLIPGGKMPCRSFFIAQTCTSAPSCSVLLSFVCFGAAAPHGSRRPGKSDPSMYEFSPAQISINVRRVLTSDCSPPIRQLILPSSLFTQLCTCRQPSIESNTHIDLLLSVGSSWAVRRWWWGRTWRISNANHATSSGPSNQMSL